MMQDSQPVLTEINLSDNLSEQDAKLLKKLVVQITANGEGPILAHEERPPKPKKSWLDWFSRKKPAEEELGKQLKKSRIYKYNYIKDNQPKVANFTLSHSVYISSEVITITENNEPQEISVFKLYPIANDNDESSSSVYTESKNAIKNKGKLTHYFIFNDKGILQSEKHELDPPQYLQRETYRGNPDLLREDFWQQGELEKAKFEANGQGSSSDETSSSFEVSRIGWHKNGRAKVYNVAGIQKRPSSISLNKILSTKEAIDFSKKTSMSIAMSGALKKMHAEDFIHGNINMENIVFNDERTAACMTNYAAARLTSEPENRDFVCNRLFLPPERRQSQASDMYSFGVLLAVFFAGELDDDFFEHKKPAYFNSQQKARDLLAHFEMSLCPAEDSPESQAKPLIEKLLQRLLDNDPEKRPSPEEAEIYLQRANACFQNKNKIDKFDKFDAVENTIQELEKESFWLSSEIAREKIKILRELQRDLLTSGEEDINKICNAWKVKKTKNDQTYENVLNKKRNIFSLFYYNPVSCWQGIEKTQAKSVSIVRR